MPYILIDTEDRAGDAAQRAAQLAQALAAVSFLEESLCRNATNRQRCGDLLGLCRATCEALSGLAPLGPDLPVSPGILGQINRVTGMAGQLLRGDPYFGYFVPSFAAKHGVPKHGEVLCVLRHLLQALERYEKQTGERQSLLEDRLAQARTVSTALVIAAETGAGYVLCRDVKSRGVDPHPSWFLDFGRSLSRFDFKKLNVTLLESYFRAGL
jgi:hypothetical protein